MYIIAGLGNPGEKYRMTRHNAGFMVIDEIAKLGNDEIVQTAPPTINNPLKSEMGKVVVDKAEVLLVKPMTYMNNSGYSVMKVISQYPNFPISNLIVAHDDITLKFGHVKISKDIGAGKHKGVQSIINHLKTKDFIRVRCGIGRGEGVLSDVVLSKFRPEEKAVVGEMIEKSKDACVTIVRHGIESAMASYN